MNPNKEFHDCIEPHWIIECMLSWINQVQLNPVRSFHGWQMYLLLATSKCTICNSRIQVLKIGMLQELHFVEALTPTHDVMNPNLFAYRTH